MVKVQYYNYDGTILLYEQCLKTGDNAAGSITPVRSNTPQYQYTFVGWNEASNQTSAAENILSNITTNKVVYAAYSATVKTYTIYFYNEETLLQTVEEVPYGGSATYSNSTPTKTGYIFSGWNPNPTNIIGNMSCYAQFVAETTGIISDDWATIAARSGAGTAANYYSIGDCKPIYLNGTMGTVNLDTTLYAYIIDIDHFIEKQSPGITFGCFRSGTGSSDKNVGIYDAKYLQTSNDGTKNFNVSHFGTSTYFTWQNCDLRYDILGSTNVQSSFYGTLPTYENQTGYNPTTTCATNPVPQTLMSCLPSNLRTIMQPIIKYTDSNYNSSYKDYLPLLSLYQVLGDSYSQNIQFQKQYAYYVLGNNKAKYKFNYTSGASTDWTSRNTSYTFYGQGNYHNMPNTQSFCISPIFLVHTQGHTVKYFSEDGITLLGYETVADGENANGLISNPTKESTAQYNYSFVGWNTQMNQTAESTNVLQNITEDKNVYAAFSETLRTYTVTFYNYQDNTVLQIVQNVPYGGNAVYTGATPTKAGYVFEGWSPSPENIIGDTSCYAQFKKLYITDSWEVISQRSNAGTAANYYAVGDCKPVYLNGTMGTLALDTTLYVYILGFDHNLPQEAPYKNPIVISGDEEKLYSHSITFGGFKTSYDNGADVALIDSHYNSYNTSGLKWFNMNHYQGSSLSGHNFGGWKGCDMRYDILGSTNSSPSGYGAKATTSNVGYNATSTCATTPVTNTLMSCLSSELRVVMKPIRKYTDNKGNSSNTSANVTASIDYLPLLSEYEVQGIRKHANQYEQNNQAQYAYYAAGNSKVKYRHSATISTAQWWVRSPLYNYASSFCRVGTGGGTGNYLSKYSSGVAPAFVV